MRVRLFALVLLMGTAMPAAAQSDRIDRRVSQLEDEMRAVQRKVFPVGPELQPEIAPPGQAAPVPGIGATSPVADLTARVDALESQLARLTGQVEETSFRLRQLEDSVKELRSAPPPPVRVEAPPPVIEPSQQAAPPLEDETVSSGDPAEDAYLAGYRLWEAHDYAGAEQTLEAMAKKYPKHRRASWARNLAGRAYLDDGKPATAAKVLLGNYQTDAKGERAADSLYFLGQALVQLKKTEEACQVYAELDQVYGDTMRDFLRERLPKAREDAKCD